MVCPKISFDVERTKGSHLSHITIRQLYVLTNAYTDADINKMQKYLNTKKVNIFSMTELKT